MKDKIKMKNKASHQDSQPNHHYTFTPTITTMAIPILFGRRKDAGSVQEKTAPNPKPNPKALIVAKYELSDNVVKFFDAKGFPKKRWVTIKEIPVKEITSVESSGNELNITCGDAVYLFVFKQKSESFDALRVQIQGLLDEQKKTVEKTEKNDARKSDLKAVINSSIGIVDLSFDILMGLQQKRVDWARLEGYSESLGSGWNFTGQTLAPLNLDFAGVSAAIKRQVPKETSKEAYIILKSIYGYFDGLNTDTDQDPGLNVKNAKAAILAYYMINDLLFGRVLGEKDNGKESGALESVLLGLAGGSNVKVSFEALMAGLGRLDVENESVVEDTRTTFREQLKLL